MKKTHATVPPTSKSLRDLLEEGRHVAVIPRDTRMKCHGSGEVWTREHGPLLAVRLDPKNRNAVQALAPRRCQGASGLRRLVTLSISEIQRCDGKMPAPAPATPAELQQIVDADNAARRFDEQLRKTSRPKIIPFEPALETAVA